MWSAAWLAPLPAHAGVVLCGRVVTGVRWAVAGGRIAGVRWRIRRYVPAADREWAQRLWAAAMPSWWPVLPAGIAVIGGGLVAVAEGGPVGLAGVDLAGSVPLILVHPGWQGRGIGTGLLAAAVDLVRAGGAREVTAGSGGSAYIWPGVPVDLPAAFAFFTARGWWHSDDTLDLVADLAAYRAPAAAAARAASAGVSLALAGGGERAEVVAFEAAAFPQWVRWFAAGQQDVLIARDSAGNIAGALLLDGPGVGTVFAPMLGPAAGTIGCVGVAPPLRGRGIGTALVTRASQILSQAGTRACHIGWAASEDFYRRAGYQPWRRYAMFHNPG
jgi:GNAT superfamily N-acetyltransferase